MITFVRVFLLFFTMVVLGGPAQAGDVPREQIKGLDEQVQEIKSDVLRIAADLNQLEEKLLYPSSTEVVVFVSQDEKTKFRLDSLEIRLDGKPVTHYLYTYKELEALQKGGVQRLYTGNIASGDHEVQVLLAGKTPGGGDLRRTERFSFRKDVGPRLLEIHLAGPEAQTIALKDR